MGWCYKRMPIRTKLGMELYRKIRGFKRFLEKSHKRNLEEMVNYNPTYFYNIL